MTWKARNTTGPAFRNVQAARAWDNGHTRRAVETRVFRNGRFRPAFIDEQTFILTGDNMLNIVLRDVLIANSILPGASVHVIIPPGRIIGSNPADARTGDTGENIWAMRTGNMNDYRRVRITLMQATGDQRAPFISGAGGDARFSDTAGHRSYPTNGLLVESMSADGRILLDNRHGVIQSGGAGGRGSRIRNSSFYGGGGAGWLPGMSVIRRHHTANNGTLITGGAGDRDTEPGFSPGEPVDSDEYRRSRGSFTAVAGLANIMFMGNRGVIHGRIR